MLVGTSFNTNVQFLHKLQYIEINITAWLVNNEVVLYSVFLRTLSKFVSWVWIEGIFGLKDKLDFLYCSIYMLCINMKNDICQHVNNCAKHLQGCSTLETSQPDYNIGYTSSYPRVWTTRWSLIWISGFFLFMKVWHRNFPQLSIFCNSVTKKLNSFVHALDQISKINHIHILSNM